MKKTFLLALIMICGISAKAQKIELGINGGLAPYVWADNSFKNFGGSKKNQPGYYASGRVSLMMAGFQLGVGLDMFQTGVKSSFTDTTGTYKNATKYSTLTPYLFLNKIFRLPKSYIYAGLNAGYNSGTARSENTYPFGTKTGSTKYSGYNGGVQLGFTLNLAKGLGANAEAGAKYLQMQPEAVLGIKPAAAYHVVFPVSLGVRYTF